MKIQTAILGAALVLAGCGGGVGAVETGAGNFAGQYAATWMSLAHITSPAGVPDQPYEVSATVTIVDTVGHSFIASDTANNCTQTYDRSGDTAVTAPDGQSCTQTLTNGATQTSTDNCTATISGAQIVVSCNGDATGVNAGVPYTGTFTGGWTGTRL